ncbi:50S ribosomal protein L35 [Coriobacteriia bacterium Es71-Z0120]|jgi:large subunit ribosomal protein L35|uniref:50S ribosomal protein L35 n=1 Tax=Parvivirga hydrogeniphila TaxID=2939460 RepID=UPI002260CDA7|nr:50S ribosomal protein L35 [Parvivirga hydrogeniphila]MCL4079257.1 50S ribosomal protein L35 [Parvivirga hydrogeniphila]
MPKMKTHRGAAKRFRLTGRGKIRRGNAYSSHILEKKSPKRKRAFRQPSLVSAADTNVIKKKLGIG